MLVESCTGERMTENPQIPQESCENGSRVGGILVRMKTNVVRVCGDGTRYGIAVGNEKSCGIPMEMKLHFTVMVPDANASNILLRQQWNINQKLISYRIPMTIKNQVLALIFRYYH